MPRQARLDARGTLHHVMIRGIERSLIFKDNQDRQDFVSRMGVLALGKCLGSPIKRHQAREKSIPTVRGVSSSPSVVGIGVSETNQ
jgi:hypothetical protein